MKKIITVILIFLANETLASDFGTSGIIDIPSARMMDDGILKATISHQDIANIYNITYQATPWLQSTFRYSIFNPSNPIRNSSGIDGLNDRSYSFKINLVNEGRYKPQVAIGIKDIIGTGAWSSEYIVATKKLSNLDFTIGLGWGRLSDEASFKNPFTYISDSYINRNSDQEGGGQFGGKLRTNSFFKGSDVGVFGGFKYAIPKTKFNIMAEYNTDSYNREIKKRTISNSSPFSIGIQWDISHNSNFTLSYQQGNQTAFSFSSNINTKKELPEQYIEPYYSSIDGYELSGADKSLNFDDWYHRLFFDLMKSGVFLRSAKIIQNEKKLIMEISNLQHNVTADALNKVFSISQIHIPSDINIFEAVIIENNHRAANVVYSRDSIQGNFDNSEKEKIKIINMKKIKKPDNYTIPLIPHVNFDLNLATKFQVFDPENPVKYQVYLKTGASIALPNNWNLMGVYATDIKNDFDMNYVQKSSSLPNVRTDINDYLVKGSSGIDSLYLEKRSRYEDLYYRLYFGVLESMYSGLGIEILYQPYIKSRFAFGATINKIRKRGYRRNFDLLEYKTTTGFVSLYYASPFYNYDFALHMGRYLAKDRGATIEIRRTFDNGFTVGAFATFTNVSAADFGEGSFDKGLFFKIPFNAFGLNTKSAYSTVLRSIQRDGGQRLDGFSGKLWHELRNVRYDNLIRTRERMIPK